MTSYSTDTISLSWTDSSNNENGFQIWRSTDGTTFASVTTVSSNVTSYTDTDLTPNTTYYYKVRAYNDYGYSAYTNVASQTTSVLPTQSFLSVNSVSVTPNSSQTITIHAQNLSDIGGIEIFLDYDPSYMTVNTNVGNNGVIMEGPLSGDDFMPPIVALSYVYIWS